MVKVNSFPKIQIKYTSIEGDSYELNSQEISGEIISLKINKSIEKVSGDFTINFIARNNLQTVFKNYGLSKPLSINKTTAMDLFAPAGLLDITINDQEVMIGQVDSVKRIKSIGDDGKPNFIFVIRGRDLGAMLEDHQIWFEKNPKGLEERINNSCLKGYVFLKEVANLRETAKILEKVNSIFFKDVLNKEIVGKTKPFRYVDGDKLEDKINVSTVASGGTMSSNVYLDEFQMNFEAFSKEADLWNFFKSFTTPPFNEIFFTTGGRNIDLSSKEYIGMKNGKGYLVYRPCPYDDINTGIGGKSNFSIHDLDTFEIEDSLIVNEDFNSSKNGIPSVYRIYPNTAYIPISQSGFIVDPIYDERALRRYGYNEYQVSLLGIDGKVSDAENSFQDICKNYTTKLYEWFRCNDLYLTGSMTMKGNEKVFIGTKLKYNSKDKNVDGYGYITGVDHDINFASNSFTTSITFDRFVRNFELVNFKNKDRN